LTAARSAGADPEREAELLSRVIDTISAGLDLDRILQGVARLVTETADTDVCFVHLLDEHGTRLQLRGATPPFDDLVGKIELALGEGVSGWVALHGEPAVLVDHKADDPRYRYIPALHGEDFTSMVSVPVVTPLGHLVGVLNVHTRLRREFTSADVELLRSVAGLVAGAIENARLHRRLAEREEALEQFAEQMVEWQEHESRRLAGEIHDGISQRIVSLFFHLSAAADAIPGEPEVAAEQVARAQELAAAALDETRSAIAGLRPPVLDDLGLAASLESLGRSFPQLDVQVEAWRPRCTARRRRPCRTWSSTLRPLRSGCTWPCRPTASCSRCTMTARAWPPGRCGGQRNPPRPPASACPACGSGQSCSAGGSGSAARPAAAPRSAWSCRSARPLRRCDPAGQKACDPAVREAGQRCH